MPTTRTPIGRRGRPHITPHAIELFDDMCRAAAQCTCPTASDTCQACELEKRLRGDLEDALGLRPWETIQHPDSECVYPPGRAGYDDWPAAQQRWRALEAASREARRTAKVARA
jgi:hypothetical protein